MKGTTAWISIREIYLASRLILRQTNILIHKQKIIVDLGGGLEAISMACAALMCFQP
jgi:hypothetical protein